MHNTLSEPARPGTDQSVAILESELNSFDTAVRKKSLAKLKSLNILSNPEVENLNLHTHTFFSYNALGWSPTRYAWEAAKAGLYAAGSIDFDVLDGVEEFLDAGLTLGLRTTTGFEIRAFLNEFSEVDIDSPGEPGVHYMAGTGFVKIPPAGSAAAKTLEEYRQTATNRNLGLVSRINAKVGAIALDYHKDVLPLTPSGNATERHIISAYLDKSIAVFPILLNRVNFWSELLGTPAEEILKGLENRPGFEEKIRGKFAKRGGFGYEKPGPTTFPEVGGVYAWVKACGAIPMDSWLDGTSAGEARARELFECNRSLGARVLNLIPDRNWNVKNPEEKRLKLDNLARVIALAKEFHTPLNIGTEGNKLGLPFVDDLSRPEFAPHKGAIIQGAKILIGHAVLARFADYAYLGAGAEADFGPDIRKKNLFFESIGALPPLGITQATKLRDLGTVQALAALRTSALKGFW